MSINSFYHKKTILITGAASGIGKHFAERVSELAEECTLILWDRNRDPIIELQDSLSKRARVETAVLDVTDQEQIEKETSKLDSLGLLPDLILNSAGIVVGNYFSEHTSSDIERTFQINTIGSMFVAHAFFQKMVQRGSGILVNMGSASGYIGNPRMSVYAASKWAIHGWSESLRLELKAVGSAVRVVTVIPSYIDTGMFEGVTPPRFVPLLTTENIVNRMLIGIARGKQEIRAPFLVHFVPFLKAVLPTFLFDWIAGSLLGVYGSMNTFKGKST